MFFPVSRDLPGRPGSGLTDWVVLGRGELGPFAHLVRTVVVEPVLARFETTDDPMSLRMGVSTRVLAGRGIATADVTTFGTTAQMEPPPVAFQAFDAAVATRGRSRVDQRSGHWTDNTGSEPVILSQRMTPESGVAPRSSRSYTSGKAEVVWRTRLWLLAPPRDGYGRPWLSVLASSQSFRDRGLSHCCSRTNRPSSVSWASSTIRTSQLTLCGASRTFSRGLGLRSAG